jgi:glutaredoxin
VPQPSAQPEGGASAPVIRQDSDGWLFTWIDDKGDFHVETAVTGVPEASRETVRVEGQADDLGDPGRVFVVDLRQSGSDGTYPVRTITRTEFEALAVARRAEAGPTLAVAEPSPSGAPDPRGDQAMAEPKGRPTVVIYGAEWCGACHEAARYLRHKGVSYVEKDVEADAAAAREMREKLAKNGLRGGSIPVIDVRGKVMVGFNAQEIDAALGSML